MNINGNIKVDGTPLKNMFLYSTTEQVIGKWIDGKTLYQKVLTVNVNENSAVTYNLSGIGYETLWIDNSASFNTYGNSQVTYSGINWFSSSDDFGLCYVNVSKLLNIKNISTSKRVYYITIKYTKTK